MLKGLDVAGEKATFKIEYPDGTAHQFDAIPSVKLDAGAINGALTFSTTMLIQSDIIVTNPTALSANLQIWGASCSPPTKIMQLKG